MALGIVGLLIGLLAAFAAAYWYSLSLPGKSFTGPAPPVTEAEADLAQRLRRHVVAIASQPHNVAHHAALERSAAYIEAQLALIGYSPQSQVYAIGDKPVRNIAVELAPADADARTPSLVVGAHYDSAGLAPAPTTTPAARRR